MPIHFLVGKNQKTYLFAGNAFLRYDEHNNAMEQNYPATIRDKWRGIPNDINAVISMTNGGHRCF